MHLFNGANPLFPFDPAEAPLTLRIIAQRLQKALGLEIRPIRLREPELRIRRLPKQEVAQAHVAARADHEVDGRKILRVKSPLKGFRSDVLRRDLPRLHLLRQALHGAADLILPTVIDGCTSDMDCVHDEAFGPTVTIETFTTEDEAVAIANDTEYGLAGAVWSSNPGTTERVAARLRHGTIWINDFRPYLPQAEWGGMKMSGNGRELGPTGLAEYQEHKHVYHTIAPGVTGWFAQ